MDFQYNLHVQIYWGVQWGLQDPVSTSGCHMCFDIMGGDCMTPFLPSQGVWVSGILCPLSGLTSSCSKALVPDSM